MSIPERVFRLSKAYMDQVRDRIEHELSDAERELDADATSQKGGIDSPSEEAHSVYRDSDPEAMMRRAEARIAAARRDLESRTEAARSTEGDAPSSNGKSSEAAAPSAPKAKTPVSAAEESDPNYHDYRVLGLSVGSDLAQVQAEYENLSRRCDPRRFPDGSAEQKQAETILARVNTAYEALRRRLDPTENRFGKLELE